MGANATRLDGLSPRVRGNLEPDPPRLRFRGSIPACAGEPNSPDRSAGTARVYPRVCGGTAFRGVEMTRTSGLSPRVRGNRNMQYRFP